jgi:hypothetical protein
VAARLQEIDVAENILGEHNPADSPVLLRNNLPEMLYDTSG